MIASIRQVMKNLFATTTVLMLLSCGAQPTGSTPGPALPPHSSTAAGDSTTPTSPAPLPAPVGPSGESSTLTECEEVGLERKGVRWTVDGAKQLLLFVPIHPAIGEPYVLVWTPDVNTTLLGRGPANEWFSVSLPQYGSWRIRLAAETIDHNGRVRQCDRHSFVVVAIPATPPTPEPEPEPCDSQELLVRAVIECDFLEVKSIDFEACTFECNTP